MTMTNLMKQVGGNALVNDLETISKGNYGPKEIHEIGANMARSCMAQRPANMSEYEFAHRAEDFFQQLIWENFSNDNLVHAFQACQLELRKYMN